MKSNNFNLNKYTDFRESSIRSIISKNGLHWLNLMKSKNGIFSAGYGLDYTDGNPTPIIFKFDFPSIYYNILNNGTTIAVNPDSFALPQITQTTTLEMPSNYTLSYKINSLGSSDDLQFAICSENTINGNFQTAKGYLRIARTQINVRGIGSESPLYNYPQALSVDSLITVNINSTNQITVSGQTGTSIWTAPTYTLRNALDGTPASHNYLGAVIAPFGYIESAEFSLVFE